MTKTRVLAALIMAPVAIAAILLLPTQWLAAAAAAVLLIGLWPDFDAALLQQALDAYGSRERRFGLTSAQIAALATETSSP